jgi:uncharacterized membrane protein YvlD (DUF360 family)
LTLGLLSFFVRIFVLTILIKFAANLFKGFKIRGWDSAFIVAFAIAIAGTALDYLL